MGIHDHRGWNDHLMTDSLSMDHSSPRERRSGFTIVEVLFALIILTVGILGLASTTLFVVRQTQVSEVATERVAALQSVIERLNATPYNDVASSVSPETIGIFEVSWEVTEGSLSKRVVVTTTGPGLTYNTDQPTLSSSVSETFEYRILSR